jgi:hypothetical protein
MPKESRILKREMFLGETLDASIKRFETDINSKFLYKPVKDRLSGRTIIGEPWTLSNLPMKKFMEVTVDDELVAAKVMDTVIRGAEEEINILENFCKIVDMDAPIKSVPLITPDDFKIYQAAEPGHVQSAGGVFDRVKLDCSNQKGLYKTDVNLDKTWLRDNGWDAMEEALWAAGQAVYMDVATKVLADIIADVSTATPDMTDTVANWGASHYKALVKMDSLLRAQGFTGPFAVIINPSEVYDIMILDYFIHQDYAKAALGVPRTGALIGYLFGVTPIYCHRGQTTAYMTMLTVGKSAVLGRRMPLQMEGYDDVREGLEGSVLAIQYDFKNGSDAELTKPTKGSWAVAASA